MKNNENSIGLTRGTVKVITYNPSWPTEFNIEKQRLRKEFGDKIISIEHIGSTSIPGLPSKPIIDIVVSVRSFDDLPTFITGLQEMGYEYIPDRMWDNRKFFPKGSQQNRTHHLNIVLDNDPDQWIKPIMFRDYLRTHHEVRDEYAKLKLALANEHPDNRASYTQSKDAFIQSVFDSSRVSP